MLFSLILANLYIILVAFGTTLIGLVLYRPFHLIQTPTIIPEYIFTTSTLSLVSAPSSAPASLSASVSVSEPAFTPDSATAPVVVCTVSKLGSSVVDCGTCGNLTPHSGTIQSPNYPQEYLTDSHCQYTISVISPPSRKIKLKFSDFVVEDCGIDGKLCDTVSVFDGTSSGSLFGDFTGYQSPADITSTTFEMTIVFSSDGGNDAIPFTKKPGRWKATYNVV